MLYNYIVEFNKPFDTNIKQMIFTDVCELDDMNKDDFKKRKGIVINAIINE